MSSFAGPALVVRGDGVRFRSTRRHLGRYSPLGLLLGLLAYCVSTVPTILPRSWYLTAVVGGLSVVLGYALGTAVDVLARRTWAHRRDPLALRVRARFRTVALRGRPLRYGAPSALLRQRLGRRGRRFLVLLAVVLLPAFAVNEVHAQARLSASVGEPAPSTRPVLTLLVGTVVALVLLSIGRGLRRFARWLASLAPSAVPFPAARFAAGTLTIALVLVSGDQLIGRTVLPYANQLADATNDGTPTGVLQPVSPLRSGSVASIVTWQSLGREGRTFVAGGPDQDRIREVTGEPAMMPVRVFTGTGSSATAADRVELAIRELDRTGAFHRRVLAVVGTTGSGWVDPALTNTLEYLYEGDTAEVAVQYSHLPSWLSFVSDRSAAVDVQRRLLAAVRARVQTMPADQRPRVLLLGESLGAYSGEDSVGSLGALEDEVDGALFAGSPASARLSQRLMEQTAAGAALPAGVAVTDGDQQLRPGSERVVFVQHASDPIRRWSPDLLWSRPVAPDLPGSHPAGVQWLPGISFLQVSSALVGSRDVEAGAGHVYGPELVDAMAALGAPADWDSARAAAVRAAITADTAKGHVAGG